MITLRKFSKYLFAFFLVALASSAFAQSAAGNWDLTEPSGGPAIGKMILSRGGSIDFDGTIGSWSQSGNRITATVYGSQQLRAAGIPVANLEFTLNGDTMSGSMTNLVNKKTNAIGARRQGASMAKEKSSAREKAGGNVDSAPAGTPTVAKGGSGRDAKECIMIRQIPKKGGSDARQSITNTCSEDIGVNYCHGPSSRPGTASTECGAKGRYYQQFTTMRPGQTDDNPYSMPPDAEIRYGACFGGQGKIKQTEDGHYNCK
jgi:hypothetical protein